MESSIDQTMPILSDEEVEAYGDVTVPILGPEIIEMNSEDKPLFWRITTVMGTEEWSITAFLKRVMWTNLAWAYYEISKLPEMKKSALRTYTQSLEMLEAAIIKTAAQIASTERKIVGLRAKHMTMENVEDIHVPKLYTELLKIHSVLRQIVVVKNGQGFTAGNPEACKQILNKIDIDVPVKRVNINTIRKLLEEEGTFVSLLVRHPIIGYMVAGTTEISDIAGIGVREDIAEKLDGDDDGDFVEVTPLAYIVGNQRHFIRIL